MKIQLKSEGLWALTCGSIICILQILLCLILAPRGEEIHSRYLRLNQWDSYHYLDIAERGYHIPKGPLTAEDVHSNRANVGYFPAFPLISKWIGKGAGVSPPISLLMTAQLFCILFWTQFLLLTRSGTGSRKDALKKAVAGAIFPASFFLVAGYSESLFLASLMGVILWTEIWIKKTQMKSLSIEWFIAALFGLMLSATRLVGIPCMFYPLIRSWSAGLNKSSKVSWIWALGLTFISGLGGLLFFAWCEKEFGSWDLYLKLQTLGWGNQPNYFALLDPRSYIPQFFFEDTTNSVCRASNLFILAMGFYSWKVEQFTKNTKIRFGIYFVAFCIFFVSVSGKANYKMDSMVRYNLPVFILFLLAWAQSRGAEVFSHSRFNFRIWMGFGYLIALACQIWMILLYMKGGWVA